MVEDASKDDYITTGAPRVSNDTLNSDVSLTPKSNINAVKFVKPNCKKVRVKTVKADNVDFTVGFAEPTIVDEQIKDSIK